MTSIKIKYFDKACELEQHGDWIDLKAAKDMEYNTHDAFMIPLGVAMQLPEGYEAIVLPRSSTFKNYGIILTNSMGVIDEAYCGDDDQWHFPAYALRAGKICKGDRIAQFRVQKHQEYMKLVKVDALNNENRGGFGSSGR